MKALNLKPTHKAVKTYYHELQQLSELNADKEGFEYRLGNRSALHWIIDQYRVKTDKRSGIVNDPNHADESDYIVNLIQRVITVSVETVKIVKALPALEEMTIEEK